MMLRLGLLLVLAVFGALMGGGASAQFANDDRTAQMPAYCTPRTTDDLPAWRQWMTGLGPDWLVEQPAAEAHRIGDDPSAFRHLDRLYLALDDGKLATLTDCPFGDGMYVYFYEQFDDIGHFYVIWQGRVRRLHLQAGVEERWPIERDLQPSDLVAG